LQLIFFIEFSKGDFIASNYTPNDYSIQVFYNGISYYNNTYSHFNEKLKKVLVDPERTKDFCGFKTSEDIYFILAIGCLGIITVLIFGTDPFLKMFWKKLLKYIIKRNWSSVRSLIKHQKGIYTDNSPKEQSPPNTTSSSDVSTSGSGLKDSNNTISSTVNSNCFKEDSETVSKELEIKDEGDKLVIVLI